jgi:hypothetical protein
VEPQTSAQQSSGVAAHRRLSPIVDLCRQSRTGEG